MAHKMKDDNWASGRQSILRKYDKNGDGVYDNDEVNSIIDDYMATMKSNVALIDTNEGQKKIIIFSAIMILLLFISNFATAFLAVNLAKEVRVSSDGTMTKADGTNKALKTLSKVESLQVSGNTAPVRSATSRRSLAEGDNVDINDDDEEPVVCLSDEEVMMLYKNTQEGSGTTLIIGDENDPDAELSFFIGGRAQRAKLTLDTAVNSFPSAADGTTDFVYTFPDSKWSFHKSERCHEHGHHRRLGQDGHGRKLEHLFGNQGHPGDP